MLDLKWVSIRLTGFTFYDLRDTDNRILGWVRPREAGILCWIAADGMQPRDCPCTTLEEAKRFVETQYILSRGE